MIKITLVSFLILVSNLMCNNQLRGAGESPSIAIAKPQPVIGAIAPLGLGQKKIPGQWPRWGRNQNL